MTKRLASWRPLVFPDLARLTHSIADDSRWLTRHIARELLVVHLCTSTKMSIRSKRGPDMRLR